MAKMHDKFYILSIQLAVVLMLFFPLLGYAGDEGFGADSSALSMRNVDKDTPPASSTEVVPKRAAFIAKPQAGRLPPAEGRFIIKSDRNTLPQISLSDEFEIKSDGDIDDNYSSSGKIVGDAVDPDQNSKIPPRRILESIDPNSVTPASPPTPSGSSPKKKQKSPAKIVVPNGDMRSGAAPASLNKKFVPRAQPKTLAKAQGKIEIGRSSTSVGAGNDQSTATKASTFADSIVDQDDVKAIVVATPPEILLQTDDVGATIKAAAVKRQFTKKAAVKTLAKPVYIDSLPTAAAKVSVVQRVIGDGVQIDLNAPRVVSQNKVLAIETGIRGVAVTDGLKSDIITPDLAIFSKDITHDTQIVWPQITQNLGIDLSVPRTDMEEKIMDINDENITPPIGDGRVLAGDIPQLLMQSKELIPNTVIGLQEISGGRVADQELLYVHMMQKTELVANTRVMPPDVSSISSGNQIVSDLPELRMLGKEAPSRDVQVVVPYIKAGDKIEIEVQLPDVQMQKKKIDADSRVIISLVPGGVNVDSILPDTQMRPKGRAPVMDIAASSIVQGKQLTGETAPVIGPQKKIDTILEVNVPMVERGVDVDIDIPDIPIVPKVIILDSGLELPQVSLGIELEDALPDVPMLSKRMEPVISIVMPSIEAGNELVDDLPPIGMNQKDVVVNDGIILPIIAPGLEADESQPVAHVNDKPITPGVVVISPAIPLGNRADTNIVAIPAKLHVTEGDTTVLMSIESPISDSQYHSYSISQSIGTTNDSREEYITEEQSYSMNDQLSLGSDKVVELGGIDEFVATIPVSEITKTVADYVKQGMHYAISSFETINAIISARLDIFKSELTVGVAAGDENNVVEKGMWSKIFTSKTTQDNSIGKAEFNNNQNGFIIGFDAELKDENVFGVAVTKSDSKTNFFSSVDNSQKSDLYSVILYNEMSLTNKLYLNTNLKYGKAYVKHKIHTDIPLSGKTTADIFSASIDGVYKHKSTNGTLISPIFRFTFSNFFIDDFSEINDDIKVYIPHKRARVLLAQSGMGFKRAVAVGKSKLEIEFHGGIETILALKQSHDMITVISDITENIQGKFVHPTKTRYNFGANLAMVTNMGLRAGVAADHVFASRYRSSGAFLFLVYHF